MIVLQLWQAAILTVYACIIGMVALCAVGPVVLWILSRVKK